MNTTSLLRAALGASVLLAGVSSHAQTYTYQRVSASPSLITVADEVTDDGRISGYTTDYIHIHGFVDTAGTFAAITIPGYTTAQVTAINGSTLYGIVNENSGFSMTSNGSVTILRPPNFAALPGGVNGAGILVGQGQVAQGNNPAFLLQNGTYKGFLYPGSNVTDFVAINNLNVIAGTWNINGGPLQSFVLKDSQTTPIAFPGAYSTVVTGINDAGDIIGWYLPVAQAPPVMFRYDGASYTSIADPPNSYACFPRHVNNHGDFVGTCANNTTKQTYSFLATPVETKEIALPPQ